MVIWLLYVIQKYFPAVFWRMANFILFLLKVYLVFYAIHFYEIIKFCFEWFSQNNRGKKCAYLR